MRDVRTSNICSDLIPNHDKFPCKSPKYDIVWECSSNNVHRLFELHREGKRRTVGDFISCKEYCSDRRR